MFLPSSEPVRSGSSIHASIQPTAQPVNLSQVRDMLASDRLGMSPRAMRDLSSLLFSDPELFALSGLEAGRRATLRHRAADPWCAGAVADRRDDRSAAIRGVALGDDVALARAMLDAGIRRQPAPAAAELSGHWRADVRSCADAYPQPIAVRVARRADRGIARGADLDAVDAAPRGNGAAHCVRGLCCARIARRPRCTAACCIGRATWIDVA